MKIFVSLFLLLGAMQCFADDAPLPQTTRTSNKSINVESAIKWFYNELVYSPGRVQSQAEALTAQSRENNGGIYKAFEPQVIDWFPTETEWDAVRDTSTMQGRFLVVQPVGYGRSKHAGYDTALVAEFEAIYVTAPNKPNKLTITFLGFRDPNLLAAPKSK